MIEDGLRLSEIGRRRGCLAFAECLRGSRGVAASGRRTIKKGVAAAAQA